jgi:hypothetical protein
MLGIRVSRKGNSGITADFGVISTQGKTRNLLISYSLGLLVRCCLLPCSMPVLPSGSFKPSRLVAKYCGAYLKSATPPNGAYLH